MQMYYEDGKRYHCRECEHIFVNGEKYYDFPEMEGLICEDCLAEHKIFVGIQDKDYICANCEQIITPDSELNMYGPIDLERGKIYYCEDCVEEISSRR